MSGVLLWLWIFIAPVAILWLESLTARRSIPG